MEVLWQQGFWKRCYINLFSNLQMFTPPFLLCPPQELPLKVQQVLGIYVPSSSEKESPDSQASETQHLFGQSQAGAAASNSTRAPTYP